MKLGRATRWFPLLALVAFLALVVFAGSSEARPGGGHSYSGGGGGGGGYSSSGGGGYSGGGGGYSGSSDSGGGGGELVFFLFQLVFEVPIVGVPLLILGVAAFFMFAKQSNELQHTNWSSMPMLPPPTPELGELRRLDPEFSSVYFEDFMYHLYAEAHRARSSVASMALLAPQVSEKARAQLLARLPAGKAVDRVVIGSMAVVRFELPDRATTDTGQPYFVNLSLRFESNMVVGTGSKAEKYYVEETWKVSRAANTLSVPVERMKASLCSNCGAPFVDSSQRICQSCDAAIGDGRFGWLVTSTTALKLSQEPASLTGYAPERGTYDRTLEHPRMRQELAALQADDPAFSTESFSRRCQLIFMELYHAWNDDDLARVRPFTSDSLFNYLRYWLEAYRHEGLENWVEDFALKNFVIAKVVRDRHYDAITIRLWASSKDYTVDASNEVVGGSRREMRDFSEYWTMIRRADARGEPGFEKKCPHCGAELKISMAGICEFCAAHVTAGEFDWVLSKIEQDESYHG